MRFRLIVAALLLAIDLLVMPAVAHLPDYVTGSSPPGITAWKTQWLYHPVKASLRIMGPTDASDHQARGAWLAFQAVMAVSFLLLLWPDNMMFGKYKKEGVPDPEKSGAHGTARWRTAKDIAKTLPVTAFRKEAPPPGFLAGADSQKRPSQAYIVPGPMAKGSTTNPHVLVLGGSGAGKTRRLVFPTLWLMSQANQSGQPNSLVLTDPKGELYSYTADHFRQRGYRVVTLNLIQSKRSDRYNPLAEVVSALERGETTEASDAAWELAHAFTAKDEDEKGDSFWTEAAQSIIAAAALYVASRAPEGQQTMATVYRLLTDLGQGGGEQLDMIFRAISDVADPARLAYGVTALSSDKTRSGILTTAAVNLRLFADPSVAGMTAESDYELSVIGKEPTVVYLLLPDDKSGKNSVAALYLQQMYTALSRSATASPGGRLPIPVYFVLDEFANIGKFKDFDKMISVMRGRGMAAMIILQALQQLSARYGEETADVITANCDTWLFLKTNDFKTAEQISKKIGESTIKTRSHSANSKPYDLSTGVSEQLTARALMTPDEVLRWNVGEVLILQAGQYPAKLHLADITEWPARFHEGGQPAQRIDDRANQPIWIPSLGTPAGFGVGGLNLQSPLSSPSEGVTVPSLLDRIRKSG